MVDHDGNFKRLFSMYFVDFIGLFFPELAEHLENEPIILMDKEIYEILEDEKRHADLVVRAKVRNEESFFLIHVEPHDGTRDLKKFGRRMLKYFVGLHEKYDLPVYPIVVFTFKAKRRQQPSTYQVEVADLKVLRFEYRVIQLNKLDYRQYASLKNPVATALIPRMRIEGAEKADVIFDCIMNLNSLDLAEEGRELVRRFMRDYSDMSPPEVKNLFARAEKLDSPEREEIMKSLDPWTEYGLEKGREEGSSKVVLRLLARRFGTLDDLVIVQIKTLPLPLLEQLAEDILDFNSVADLDQWLSTNAKKITNT